MKNSMLGCLVGKVPDGKVWDGVDEKDQGFAWLFWVHEGLNWHVHDCLAYDVWVVSISCVGPGLRSSYGLYSKD
jgi:hypothetical protein